MKKSTFIKPELTVEELTLALYESNKLLSDTNKQLLESELKRNELFHNISHDLRSPITTIKSHIEFLMDFEIVTPSELKESLIVMKKKIETIESMINDIFLMNHLDQDVAMSVTLKEIFIYDYLHSLLTSYKDDQRFYGKHFSFTISPSCSITLMIDGNLIARAIDNLISNAAKFTNANDSITVQAYADNSNLKILVQDTGCGIQDEHKEKIFERSFRVDEARTPNGLQGCGIGLSICTSIISLHKGTLTCDSVYGTGSTFIISIPYTTNQY